MSTSKEDEDLRLALAMSLDQIAPDISGSSAQQPATIDLTSEDEDEDEDIRRAIALSLREHDEVHEVPISVKQTSDTKPCNKSIADTPDSTALRGIVGLDRKAMEEARLARLGKRKREPSPDQNLKRAEKLPSEPKVQALAPASSSPTIQYPKGVIKRTSARGYPRTDDITIDEVFQAGSVNIAVISSFQWDSEWLHKKLDPRKVKQIWIMNAKGNDVQQRWRHEMADCRIPNLKIHFPPMDGNISSMHSKLTLLFGTDKLRVVVPTANMIATDWGEVDNDWQPGVFENTVFLIDLPRRRDGLTGNRKLLPSFGRELVMFLEAQKIEQSVINGVLKFDFEQARHLEFIHSIGGSHPSGSSNTGLPGLAKALRQQNLHQVKHMELDYVASSLGAINDAFLERIWLAARGEDLRPASEVKDVRKHIRVYFPTEETVKNSTGGTDCGGIISLFRNHYDAATFPKDCLRDHDSNRKGMLSHNKLLLARGRLTNGKAFAWVYVGSANISESAWGSQKVLKSGVTGTLSIRNWECGVLVPVPSIECRECKSSDEVPPMDVFKSTIELPFVYPGKEYGQSKPWFRTAFGH